MAVFDLKEGKELLLAVDAVPLGIGKETAVEGHLLARVTFINYSLPVQGGEECCCLPPCRVERHVIPVWGRVHPDVGDIREAAVFCQAEELDADGVGRVLEGHGKGCMGSEGRVFPDKAVNGVGEFLPLADEVGELLCISLVYGSNTVMELPVLLQGVCGVLEMVVVVFRAGGKVEDKTQKKQVKDETLLSIFSFTCLTFYHLRLCGVLVLCGSMCGMLARPYMWSLFHRRVR